jgi:outer membrane assembly lipoprotein YfiO
MSQLEGKERKAFDAYQLFIEEYKGSSLFSQAIERQFNIVQTARNNKKKKILGIGGGSSISSTEQVEMLDKIALNAPFSKYAPEARYLAAEIHRESKNYDFAILHYQQFVREYPDNSKAPTAQYEVARLLQEEAQDANNDSSQLGQTRNAYEEVLIQFPDSPLVSEARQQLTEIEQQEVSKHFDIAQFYEKTEKYKAAVIYYQRVASHPGARDYEAAKERLAEIGESHPEAFAEGGKPVMVEAKTDIKSRDDYVGPPNLAALTGGGSSKIRNSMDDVAPAPIVEPDLPEVESERPQEQPSPGLLLPPITPTGEPLPLPPAVPPASPTPPASSSPSTAQTGSQE